MCTKSQNILSSQHKARPGLQAQQSRAGTNRKHFKHDTARDLCACGCLLCRHAQDCRASNRSTMNKSKAGAPYLKRSLPFLLVPLMIELAPVPVPSPRTRPFFARDASFQELPLLREDATDPTLPLSDGYRRPPLSPPAPCGILLLLLPAPTLVVYSMGTLRDRAVFVL